MKPRAVLSHESIGDFVFLLDESVNRARFTHIRLKQSNLHDAMETISNIWGQHYQDTSFTQQGFLKLDFGGFCTCSPIAAPPGTRWRHSGINEKYWKKENQRSKNYLEKP